MIIPPRWRTTALCFAGAIFLAEVAIARYAPPGSFLRSSIGDVLVIALIYFFVRGVTGCSTKTAFIFSIMTGFVVEFLQFLHTGERLGVPSGSILGIMLGNTFSFEDLLMYAIGGALALGIDTILLGSQRERVAMR